MADVDVGLFDFDFDVTLSIFVLNHEKQIYLRYGGRDDRSPDSYLSEKSLANALSKGLAMHARWKDGQLKLPPPPKPVPAQSYRKIREIVNKGQCVHCHHVAQERADLALSKRGFDKKSDPWIFPDPVNLGIDLDKASGNRIETVTGAARAAGLKPGDVITSVDGKSVATFSDLQYALHHVGKNARTFEVGLEKGGKKAIKLPDHWRVTDINRRAIGHRMRPFPEFWAHPITEDRKKELGLKPGGFAGEATRFWVKTNGDRAGLKQGDIIYEVDGVQASPLAKTIVVYIRTHYKVGDTIKVRYKRDGKDGSAEFQLRARPW